MKKILKITIFLLTIAFALLLTRREAKAIEAWVSGKVFLTLDGRQIPLSGVVVIREDTGSRGDNRCCGNKGCCWGINRGPISVSMPTGYYGFSEPGGPGVILPCGTSPGGPDGGRYEACKGLNIGQDPRQATCEADRRNSPYYDPDGEGPLPGRYHCGLSCGDGSPQRWLAYFPPNFNKKALPAGVYFEENDLKGGGRWQTTSQGASDNNLHVKPGNFNWEVTYFRDNKEFKVTYAPQEWYWAQTLENAGGVANLNIEWLPKTAPAFECTGLGPQPIEPQPGDRLTFTCTASAQETTINHYNFRVNEGSVTQVPAPSANPNQASFDFTVPEGEGTYTVQCQVCTSSDDSVCTAWGQAR